jgi:hypothetical protein
LDQGQVSNASVSCTEGAVLQQVLRRNRRGGAAEQNREGKAAIASAHRPG